PALVADVELDDERLIQLDALAARGDPHPAVRAEGRVTADALLEGLAEGSRASDEGPVDAERVDGDVLPREEAEVVDSLRPPGGGDEARRARRRDQRLGVGERPGR